MHLTKIIFTMLLIIIINSECTKGMKKKRHRTKWPVVPAINGVENWLCCLAVKESFMLSFYEWNLFGYFFFIFVWKEFLGMRNFLWMVGKIWLAICPEMVELDYPLQKNTPISILKNFWLQFCSLRTILHLWSIHPNADINKSYHCSLLTDWLRTRSL